MTSKKTNLQTLKDLANRDNDVSSEMLFESAKWALAEIERLTTENDDLKSKAERESNEELTRKIAELAILCVDAQCEAIRLKRKVNTLLDARLNGGMLLGKDDVKK